MVLTQPNELRLELPLAALAELCRKFGVSELAVFGSTLRDDFQLGRSDVDFLVKFFNDDAGPWMEKLQDMESELKRLLNRDVDVVDWHGIEQSRNRFRREHILATARRVYAA